MNNDQNNGNPWTTFWCGLILLTAIWSVYDYYGQHYCADVVVPTLCSKD